MTRTWAGIVAASRAELLLSYLLHPHWIGWVSVGAPSRCRIRVRICAGVLAQVSVDRLSATGPGERIKREGSRVEEIGFEGLSRHIAELDGLASSRAGATTLFGISVGRSTERGA